MLPLVPISESNERPSRALEQDALTVCRVVFGLGTQSESGLFPGVIATTRVPLRLHPVELLNWLSGIDTSDSVSNSIEEVIIEHLIDVLEVVEVYFNLDRDVVDVWTIIDHSERKIRYAVYEKELKIRCQLPDVFINFRVSGRKSSSSPASMGYRRVDLSVRRMNAGHQRPPRPSSA